jgi:hypothetical protein
VLAACSRDRFLNFAEDIRERTPMVLGREPRIKELLNGNTCPQEVYFVVEIIRFRQQIFAAIECNQDQRAGLGQFKDVSYRPFVQRG